jgi:formate hydrogenlyase subunit 4
MILYAGALKLALFAAILLNVLLAAAIPGGWRSSAGAFAALAVSFVGMGVAVGVVESTMARLRQPKVPLYLAGGSALALFGLILVLR